MAEKLTGAVRQIGLVALMFVAGFCLWVTYRDFRPTALMLFADVGQGKCILLVAPNGRTMLIDAGTQTYGQDGREDLTAQKILSQFARIGVRRLDVILVTHPDKDHCNAVPILATELRPKLFWAPVGDSPEEEWQAVKTLMSDERVKTVVAQVGQRLWLDTRNGWSLKFSDHLKGLWRGSRSGAPMTPQPCSNSSSAK